MMGRGMMGRSRGKMRRGGGIPLRIIFALMDTDSDGTVSLQEWQTAHERIFKAMNTNHDGRLTLDQIRAFMTGQTETGAQQ
jgi:Ca2+-binding EF-hand superfamily protein